MNVVKHVLFMAATVALIAVETVRSDPAPPQPVPARERARVTGAARAPRSAMESVPKFDPPLHARLARWLDKAMSADSATVTRYLVTRANGDSSASTTRVASQVHVGKTWIMQFARLLGAPTTYAPDASCQPATTSGADADRLVFAIRFGDGEAAPAATVMWREQCMQLAEADHPAGSAGFKPVSEQMSKLIGRALGKHDETVARAFMSSRPPPPPPTSGTGGEATPGADEYVPVEELPEAITKVSPAYPDDAKRQGAAGTVLIQALVGRDGIVKDTRVVKSIPLLDAPAAEAVRQWRFKPAMAKGQPVAVWVVVPVNFTLR